MIILFNLDCVDAIPAINDYFYNLRCWDWAVRSVILFFDFDMVSRMVLIPLSIRDRSDDNLV